MKSENNRANSIRKTPQKGFALVHPRDFKRRKGAPGRVSLLPIAVPSPRYSVLLVSSLRNAIDF
jgi:hypothetical protein